MPKVSLDPTTRTFVPLVPFACGWKPDGLNSAWLHLRGELDLATLPAFMKALGDARASAGVVSIDLRELDFIDCSALKAIVDANALAQSAGDRLSLVRGSGQVDRVLGLTGLLELVEVTTPGHLRRSAS